MFTSKIKICAWEKAYSHWLHLFLSWSLCVIKCLFKTLVQEETKLHWLHLSDFSPVCVFKWVLKMPVCGDAYHRRLLQGSYEVRATISRKLCSSISSILYLFITSSLQFGVAHGQVLLYVGHHQVLHMNLGCKHLHFLFCWFLAFEKNLIVIIHCVFSNACIKAFKQDDTKLHCLQLFDFSPVCVFKCLLKLLAWEKAYSHQLHLFVIIHSALLWGNTRTWRD